ncbi:hypothetical protein MSPP1_001750 [Malassezia sp. CBS 17886]|nr:hypothetical protein MSPP1_001750 [Malassezia sp. CBS 17886]
MAPLSQLTPAVLIQHQKAKHFKCPLCPRRLNTAGGLGVHLGQVHKTEPGRCVCRVTLSDGSLENTLPDRASFEVEIYGMVGVPEVDLMDWQARRNRRSAQGGGGGPAHGPLSKRPKIENVALTPEQLKAQLEAHKALMSGAATSSVAAVPPPAPVGFAMNGGYADAAHPAPASGPASQPHGSKSRLAYTDTVLSPDEKMAQLPRYAYVESGESGASTAGAGARARRPTAAELF